MRVVIVVQARMSSRRLPGKVLMSLAGAPALVRLFQRLDLVAGAAERILATSEDPSDEPIATLCRQQGIMCVRGSLDDVLLRYHQAAQAARADVVVRITADCPLCDPTIVDQCIALYLEERSHVAYVSNVDERSYPDGLDVEVFSFAALDQARREATRSCEREHVTPYIRRHMRKRSMFQEVDLADLRWTLDYQEDYDLIGRVFDELGGDGSIFSADDVYRFFLRHPELIRTGTRLALSEAERNDVLTRIHEHLARKS